MSFYPSDVARRGRVASVLICGVLVFLLSAFFNTQVLKNKQLLMQSEENRLRQIPLPAPRGIIYDRNNKLIADNVALEAGGSRAPRKPPAARASPAGWARPSG